MPESWLRALNDYYYPVNLNHYWNANRYPDYFNRIISGNRVSTIEFEAYFRGNCQKIEVWYEVVFWKMYSQSGRRDEITLNFIKNISTNSASSGEMLHSYLQQFIRSPSIGNFEKFRKSLGFRSNVIATAATFPAFLNPEMFPMVDTRVAKWVNSQLRIHNQRNRNGPQLVPSVFGRTGATVLTMNDFDFYIHWIEWTRHMATKLAESTGVHWRARDVEMAVFTAWGDRGCKHPFLKLNPI